jgi:hypothetical protein
MKLESQMAMLQQFDPDRKNTKQKIRFYVFFKLSTNSNASHLRWRVGCHIILKVG